MVFTLGNPDFLCEPLAAGSCSVSSPEEYRKLNFPRAVLLGSGHCVYVLLVSGCHLLGVLVACGAQEILLSLGDGLGKMTCVLGSTLVLLMRQSWRLLKNFTSFPCECGRAVLTWTWTLFPVPLYPAVTRSVGSAVDTILLPVFGGLGKWPHGQFFFWA